MRKIVFPVQWLLFEAEDLPEVSGVLNPDGSGKLQLGDRNISGKSVVFPSGDKINLYDLFAVKPADCQRTYLVGRFDAPEAGRILIGFGAEWRWRFFFNGELILDAMTCGNQQMPIDTENHFLLLDCLKGQNQLVLELYGTGFRHEGIGGGMDTAIAFYEVPENLAFRYRPLVSFPDSSCGAVSVIFTGSRASAAAVDFRRAGEEKWQRIYHNLGGQIRCDQAVHHIRLEDLDADTRYEYRAVLLDRFRVLREEIYSGVNSFTTAPADDKEFSFALTADLQLFEERFDFLTGMLGKNAPAPADFCVFDGDLYWTTNFDLQVMEQFIEPYLDITDSSLPLVMVRGNHEIYGNESYRYFEGFSAPYPGREGYYLFRWGQVCFIVLDFCDDHREIPAPSTRYLHDFEPYIAAEARWLKNAVKMDCCKNARYRIVLAHGTPLGDACEYMPSHVRQVIDPLFSGDDPEVKIHLWLAGHVHRPFRSIPRENSCCSMLDPDEFGSPLLRNGENYPFPVVLTGGYSTRLGADMQLTSVNVKVTPEKLIVREFDKMQREFDRFTISPDGAVNEEFRREDFKFYNY